MKNETKTKRSRKPAAPKEKTKKIGRPTSSTNVITLHHASVELKAELAAEAANLSEQRGESISLSAYVVAILSSVGDRVAAAKRGLATK